MARVVSCWWAARTAPPPRSTSTTAAACSRTFRAAKAWTSLPTTPSGRTCICPATRAPPWPSSRFPTKGCSRCSARCRRWRARTASPATSVGTPMYAIPLTGSCWLYPIPIEVCCAPSEGKNESFEMLSVVAFAAIIVVQPPTLKGHPEVETSAAAPVRQVRGVEWTMPAARKTAWAAFTAEAGADWQVYWDADTRVPGRIFGAGISAPGVMASDATAERFARAFLSRHIDLLAPGSQPGDFVLAANRVDDGMRTVGFYQYHAGMRVLDGQVSFRFKNDHLFVIGSEALPDVVTHVARAAADPARARGLAQAWIGDDFGTQSVVLDDDAQPVIAALVRGRGAIEYRVVTRVTVDAPDV